MFRNPGKRVPGGGRAVALEGLHRRRVADQGEPVVDVAPRVLAAAIQKIGEADMVLVVFGDPIPDTVELLGEAVEKAEEKGVPVVVNYLGGAEVQKIEVDALQRNGIPVYQTPERAITALGYLNRYRLNRNDLGGN